MYQLKRFTFQLRKRPPSLRHYYWFCHVFIPIGLNQKISDKKNQKIRHNFLVSNICRTGAIPEIYWAFSTRKFNKVAYFLLTSVNISDALRDLLPFVQFKKRELFLVKLKGACNFTKSNTPPCVSFTFFKLYQWYKIAQSLIYKFAENNPYNKKGPLLGKGFSTYLYFNMPRVFYKLLYQ